MLKYLFQLLLTPAIACVPLFGGSAMFFGYTFSNNIVYDFGVLSFDLNEATKLSIDISRQNNPKIYTNGSIKISLDSSKILIGGFIFDGEKVVGNENIYTLDVIKKGSHKFKISPIENYGDIVDGSVDIVLDDPKINVTNENNSVLKNIVISPYSNTVVNTFFSSSNCLIKFNDPKINQVNLFNVDDQFLNPINKQVINSEQAINTNGNYMLCVDNVEKDQFLYFIRVGEWTSTNVYRFNNFFETSEGKELQAKANYHSPKFYTNEWFETASTSEINFLLSISINWPLPPQTNNNQIAIIIGSILGIGAIIGLSIGGYFLSKWYHKNKKARLDQQRHQIVNNKLKKDDVILESTMEKKNDSSK